MKDRGCSKIKNETMPPSSHTNWTRPLLKSGQTMQMQVARQQQQQPPPPPPPPPPTSVTTTTTTTSMTISTGAQNQNIAEHPATPLDKRIKVVLVGDGAVGKTSLVVSYSTNGFPGEYVPTAFDNYNVVVNVDGQPLNVQLCDTAGQDDFDPLRSLCYPETDVFLVCFSVVCPSSYHSVASRWINEVKKYCPNAPIILVGTKSDLRSDVRLMLQLARYGQSAITTIQGHQLAHRLGAVNYVETSALTQHDLKEAFDQAIVSALNTRREGANLLYRRRKPPPLWRRWLCCWERSSSSET
ncbi:PREDICTED: ras-related C3 botulinum toxin substrate 1-like [Cyphomyrmex costatus]|uniref:Rho-related GTP-binding protein RhoU n=1 Tax=Cyphomyrmex costatus TaxID=456900 RepID=A0A195CRE3_9HYME|nr:PREDICTED: ras-related C3 botulinum toxin substrate 1-like [Cyphomyrmex costatus]XP_018394912.1 PREDICTED: ras-related C3 botulinum toxin substrate 1-like [Cyphomyrmex costatus]XP_018394913.1 PREDICTED: ras-related C3 botulinum toxin substrate 1-like [Cyphomyrmex costatus]KYN03276.1 Rho-related GTP-binding protein RhoU [Cyphomyrmex costatus]